MTEEQKKAEMKYRLSAVVLDELEKEGLLTEEEYDKCRVALAKGFNAPIGLLEAEDMLWKKRR